MPNRHIEAVLENQTKQLGIASEHCEKTYGSIVRDKHQIPFYNETTKDLMCHPFWDDIVCWPPTLAGNVAVLPCAPYIAGFKQDKNATRTCTVNGTWYVNETTREPWADYTACADGKVVTIFTHFNTTEVSQDTESGLMPAISIISQTGYAVSLISLIIAFLIMLLIRKLHCARNILHMNLFVSFIMRALFYILKDILFVDGTGLWSDFSLQNGELFFRTDVETNNYQCKILTTLVQYFTTANYSWILIEGIYLNNLIFRALFTDSSKNLIHYIGFGWGLPLLIIIPWVITRVYMDDVYCWTTNENIIAFLIIVIPTMISVLINCVLFIIISGVLFTKLRSPMNEDTRRYQKWAKSTLVLVPLFGVHYAVFLVLYFTGQTEVWLVCDTFFGSFQGFFVAVLFCFLNGEVKTELKPYIYKFSACLVTHRVFGRCIPCRERLLRSLAGRQSVCTTMSCSSVLANGTGHRTSKSKWDMFQRGRSSTTTEKMKDLCRNGEKTVKIPLQTRHCDKMDDHCDFKTVSAATETSLCTDQTPDRTNRSSSVIEEEMSMLEKNC